MSDPGLRFRIRLSVDSRLSLPPARCAFCGAENPTIDYSGDGRLWCRDCVRFDRMYNGMFAEGLRREE